MAEEKIRKLMEMLVQEAKATNITKEQLIEWLNDYYYSKPEKKAKEVIKEMALEMDIFSSKRLLRAINIFYLAYEWQYKGYYNRAELAREFARRNSMTESTAYYVIGEVLYVAEKYLEKKLLLKHSFSSKLNCNRIFRNLITQINTLIEERN